MLMLIVTAVINSTSVAPQEICNYIYQNIMVRLKLGKLSMKIQLSVWSIMESNESLIVNSATLTQVLPSLVLLKDQVLLHLVPGRYQVLVSLCTFSHIVNHLLKKALIHKTFNVNCRLGGSKRGVWRV